MDPLSPGNLRTRVGELVVFRRPGEERTLDAELKGVLEQIWEIVQTEGGKARSSAVMTSVYASNPSHKRICQASGGIKGILKFTPSLELSTPSAGGDNHIQSVPVLEEGI